MKRFRENSSPDGNDVSMQHDDALDKKRRQRKQYIRKHRVSSNVLNLVDCVLYNNNFSICVCVGIFAASERTERAATLIWPSRTGHLYIAVPYSIFSWLAIFPFMNT